MFQINENSFVNEIESSQKGKSDEMFESDFFAVLNRFVELVSVIIPKNAPKYFDVGDRSDQKHKQII